MHETLCPAQESGDGVQGMLPCAGEQMGCAPPEAVGSNALGAVGGLGCCHVHGEHQKPPGQGAARALLGAGGLCWSDVLVLYTVTVSLEAACQGAGTWLPALYLPGPSWGYVVVASTARRALAGPCLSEPHCSLLGVRTGVRLCLPAAADICVLSLSRNGKPFRGSFTSFLGFVSSVSWLQAGWARLPRHLRLHSQAAPGALVTSSAFVPTRHRQLCPLSPQVVSESRAAAAHENSLINAELGQGQTVPGTRQSTSLRNGSC